MRHVVAVLRAQLELLVRLPHEVAGDVGHVDLTVVLVVGDAVHVAVTLHGRGRNARLQRVGHGHVDAHDRVAAVEAAERDLPSATELVARLTRDDANGAARRVAAVQRALRTTQHFDALDVLHVEVEQAGRVRLPDAVDVETDAWNAADRETDFRRRAVRAADHAQIRNRALQFLDRRNALQREILARHRDDRDWNVLQIRTAPCRRNDDFFETAALRACALLSDCRLGARGPEHGNARHGQRIE
jgi:hypothetical protein